MGQLISVKKSQFKRELACISDSKKVEKVQTMKKMLITNSSKKLGLDDFSLARGLAMALLVLDAELIAIKSKKQTFAKECRLARELIADLKTEIEIQENGVEKMTHYDQVKLQVCKELFGDDFEACNIGNVKSVATKDIKILDGKKVKFFVEKDETGRFRFRSKIVDDTPAEKEDKPKYLAQYFYGADNTAELAATKEQARKQQQERINEIGKMFQPETKEVIEKRLKSEKQLRQTIAKAISDGFGLSN